MRFVAMLLCLLSLTPTAFGKAETFTVYTYRSFISEWGPGPRIKERFEAQCQCTVNYVALDDGVSLLSRLRLEGEKTKADVVLGIDYALSDILMQQKMITPHHTAVTELSMPGAWDSQYFIPFDYSYLAFLYDKKRLSSVPHSIKELVDNKKWSVLYEDPRTSSLGLGLVLWWNKVYGQDTPSLWKKLRPHTVSVTKGWSEAYGLFLKGEADLVLTHITSPAYHLYTEKTDQYKAAIFEEGHFMQIEVAGIIAYSQKKALAEEFLTFLLSEEVQTILPRTQWMFPVKEYGRLPVEFSKLQLPTKSIRVTPRETALMRKIWIEQWLQNS